MGVRVMVIVLVGLVLVAAAVVYKTGEQEEVGERVRSEFIAELVVMPDWDRDGAYIEQLAVQLHAESFESSYVRREGIVGGEVSVDLYERIMLGAMFRRAEADMRENVSKSLLQYCDEYGIEMIDPG